MRVRVRLPRHKFEDRRFYVTPTVNTWLNGPLRQAQAFYPDDISPAKQTLALLQNYISGEDLDVGRNFKRMWPVENDIFEITTPDVRFFGWCPTPRVFIAVEADLMVNVKTHDLYPAYRDSVSRFREELDLDEPKWQPGATAYDVL